MKARDKEKAELARMNMRQLRAYKRALQTTLSPKIVIDEDGKSSRHLKLINEILQERG